MHRFIRFIFPLLLLLPFSASVAATEVSINTNLGTIKLALDGERAPITVENFVRYAESGYYDGLIFHRVIPGFMIQGGGMDNNMNARDTRAPIPNEGNNGLTNDRGTIAMARTSDPNSATAQFFINTVDNAFLNTQPGKPGYAVFGRVIEGMDVVDQISATQTETRGFFRDVPVETILIESVEIN